MRIFHLLFFICVFSGAVSGQPAAVQSRDCREEWLIRDQKTFRKYDGGQVSAIYLKVDTALSQRRWLRVADSSPFGVFVNLKLVADREGGMVTLSLDSLTRLYPPPMVISIFQPRGIHSLSTTILSPQPPNSIAENLFLRKGNYFLDFALIAVLALSIYLTFLMGNNPILALDYLNASKLFSIQGREENLLLSRVTSRVNLLFYLFCCLFCSLIILIIFQTVAKPVRLSVYFPVYSTGQGLWQWMKLSLAIAAILMLKMVLVFALSRLFGLKEVAALQFFHFIRALILAAGLIALISLVNFIFKGTGGGLHYTLLKMGAGLLVVSAGMMYLKLLALTRYHFFHLFSYLCASEIIPLVILLKVLLY